MRSLFSILFPLSLFAQHIIIDPIPRMPQLQPMVLSALDVNVQMDQHTAETLLTLHFYNPNGSRLEGTFLCPIPSASTVSRVTLDINGVATPAELLDANKARDIYEEIVRRTKDPALVSYAGNQMIQARIFPIEPHSERVLTIQLQQLIDQDNGLYTYRLPLNAQPNQFKLHGTTESGWLGSGTHKLNQQDTPAGMTFDATTWSGDVELVFTPKDTQTGLGAQFHTVDGREGWVMLRIVPPTLKTTERTHPKDIAFVVDTSGSMLGAKLEQAQAALRFCLGALKPQDRFQVVRFSTESEPLGSDWMPAEPTNLKNAVTFVDQFQALGGTNIQAALESTQSLSPANDRVQMILFITDGKPTIGNQDESKLTALVASDQRRVFSVGVGFDVNTHLLDRMSEHGSRTYVRPEEDLEVKVSALFAKIQAPVMTQLQINASGMRLMETTPERLPDLFHGQDLQVLARYQGTGKAALTLEGMVEGKKVKQRIQIVLPDRGVQSIHIPKIWAQRRVGFLLDQIRLNGEQGELIDEVKRLAKTWGIITPYTSFLVLEDDMPVASAPTIRHQSEDRFRNLSQKSGEASVMASEEMASITDSSYSMEPEPMGEIKWIGGKMFTRQGPLWQESGADPQRAKSITFASKAYFELLAKYPELREILALGSVCFLWQGETLTITNIQN